MNARTLDEAIADAERFLAEAKALRMAHRTGRQRMTLAAASPTGASRTR